MLLEVDKLEVAYGDYQVVWGVSLGVDAGESVALLGPNGSGKSTVVNAITGLLAAKAGDIRFEGASLVGKPVHHRAPLGIAHDRRGPSLLVTDLEDRVVRVPLGERGR